MCEYELLMYLLFIWLLEGVGPENLDFFRALIWQRAKRVLFEPKKGALVMYMSFAVAILGPVSHQWCDLFHRLLHSYTRHIERVVRGGRDTFLSAQD